MTRLRMPLPPLAPPYKGGEQKDTGSPIRSGMTEKGKADSKSRFLALLGMTNSGVVWSVPVSGYATLIRPTVFWIPGFQFAESCEQVRVFQLVLEIGQDVPG